MDCNAGSWQVPVAPEDRDKTTFTSYLGTFRYTRMPFGLRNARATFQRALDIVLSGVRWQSCLIYLDDVIVFSRTTEDHLRHVDEILTLFRNAGVTLKLKMRILPTTSRLSRARYNAREVIGRYGKHEIVHARNVPEKHDATTFVPRSRKRISTIGSRVLRYRKTT